MRRPWLPILATVLLLACGSAESSLEAGRAALVSGDAAGAEEHFTSALTRTPDRADLWLARGQARLALGRTEDALSDLRKAVALEPALLEGWRVLAANEVRVVDRLAAWDRVVAANPDDLAARKGRGLERLAAGHGMEAAEDLGAWVAAHPDDPEAAAVHGDALLAAGDPYAAYAAYQKSRTPASRLPRAIHPIKGRARAGDGAALTFLTKIGERSDDYLDLAQGLYDQGRLQQALEEVRKAGVVHKDPTPERARALALSATIREGLLDDPSFAATRGAASALERGRVYEDVIKECEESLSIAPNALCHRTIGHARLELKQPDEAVAQLSSAILLAPTDLKARRWRIEAASAAERWALVVEDVDALEAAGTSDVELLLRRGEARSHLAPTFTQAQARADYDRAVAQALQVGRAGPKVYVALKARGLYLAGQGEVAAAREDLLQARTLRPMRDEEVEQALAALGGVPR